ncbi:TetR/AcrR family transcriptional regulator [Ammonicoccus fulvus]|uniref:TetR/AcrR family transcriptional regulator n=1 Tax=Ammonicoccus fulvus TaxID=3138240 RepID=A0ABZ3FQC3_9ACTN
MIDDLSDRPDGRAVRWQQHNAARRAELVDSTLRAIRRHGSGVSMEDIAAEARTSKTVIYRHFSDRAGLYRAVADKVGRRIGRSIAEAIADRPDAEGRLALSGVIGAYLALTEADPEVYRFVVRPPAVEGPVADAQVHGITDDAAGILADWLSGRMGERQARVWATAIVGSVHACADRWLADPGAITRSELTAMLVELNWSGLSG